MMKSGFVAIIGRSNVGKSSLLNALIGNKVAITTPKAQTTRLPIRGILHDPRGQIVFIDTPGFFTGKKDILSARLNQAVKNNLEGVDAIVYVVDPSRPPGKEEEQLERLVKKTNAPMLFVINKIDLPPKERLHTAYYSERDLNQIATISVSATRKTDLNRLTEALFAILPEGEAHYPNMQITDLGHQQWIEEVIREKVFLALEKELPYTVNVIVNEISFRKEGGRFIDATVFTTHERYKRMIIGSKASKIKEIGILARKELEAALNTPVHLSLTVRVDPHWPERFGGDV